jgi:hypothetical protein
MSALTVPFLMPRVEEVVPDFAMLKDRLTGASVIEERYTATQVPSSGDTYTVGGSGSKLMIIRVANQNDYIDTSTMVLQFYAKGNGLTSSALDDHIFSTVDTINVKVGGQTVEVLNNVGHLMNALTQGSMPKSYYEQSGQFEGLYVYDKTGQIKGVPAIMSGSTFDPSALVTPTIYVSSASTYTALQVEAAPDVVPGSGPDVTNSSALDSKWQVGNQWLTNGRYYSVPLTLLGLCRIPTLFAARNFQDVTLEILFRSSVAGCIWQSTQSPSGATVYNANTAQSGNQTAGFVQISDVSLTYDCCRMSADYYALMDNELKMPNGSGVAYPIDTYQVQPATISAGSAGTAGTGVAVSALSTPGLTRIVVAKGTRFLKSVYGVTKLTAGENDTRFRNNSQSGNFGFNSYQVIINSKRYPQLQIQSSAMAFQELQKAYNQLGSVAGGSLIGWGNYVGQPVSRLNAGAALTNASRQDLTIAGTKDGTSLGAFPGDEGMFQVGVNLEQFLTNQPDAGGINTSTSGYQIAIELAQLGIGAAPYSTLESQTGLVEPAALTHYVILHFTRVLTLKAGAVEILD